MTATAILYSVVAPSAMATSLSTSVLLLLHRVRYGEWRVRSKSFKRFVIVTGLVSTSYQFWNYKAAQVHEDSLRRLQGVVTGRQDMRYSSAAPIMR